MKKGIAASKGYAIGTVFIQEHEEIIIWMTLTWEKGQQI